MTESDLKARVTEDMKTAMKARDQAKLSAIRLILAAVKQREVDERITMTDEQLLVVLDKMSKQRRESIKEFQAANRTDLVEKEQFELDVIAGYLPTPLTDSEVAALVTKAVADTGAASVKDMGKIMAALKPQLQGRADMAVVGQLIKQQLS